MAQPQGIKTQKTGIYFVSEAGDTISKLGAITDWNGLGGQKGEIDATNMDSDAKEFFTGLEDSGTFSVNLNLDPKNDAHKAVFALKDSGAVVHWGIGLSDGTAAPTLDGQTKAYKAPAARTSFDFDASVQQFTLSGASDNIVKAQLTLRITGAIGRTWKPAV